MEVERRQWEAGWLQCTVCAMRGWLIAVYSLRSMQQWALTPPQLLIQPQLYAAMHANHFFSLSGLCCVSAGARDSASRVGQNHIYTVHIRYFCGIFDRDITKYTVIYGVYIRFRPTPSISEQTDNGVQAESRLRPTTCVQPETSQLSTTVLSFSD